MNRGSHLDRAAASWYMQDATRDDPRAVEISYRMAQLRLEAEHERLAATSRRSSSARLWLGRALVTFGRFVEGTTPREEDCGGAVHA